MIIPTQKYANSFNALVPLLVLLVVGLACGPDHEKMAKERELRNEVNKKSYEPLSAQVQLTENGVVVKNTGISAFPSMKLTLNMNQL